MNRIFVAFTSMAFAVALVSCQETKEEMNQPLAEKEYYKTIGEQIPLETGMEWIENYKAKNSSGGRTELLPNYNVPAAQMDALLLSTTDLTGVAFHYGIDEYGDTHIVLIPVDGSLSLWSTIPGRLFVDANSGNTVSQSTAYSWALNYKNANPDDVHFHFFGKNIFDDMTALPYFNSVDIEPGINTLDLTPELLLIIWNEDLNILGRTSAEDATVYDASNACPPCAVR